VDEHRPFSDLAAALRATQASAPAGRAAGLPLYLPPYRAATVLQLARLLALTPDLVLERASLPLIRSFVAVREIKDQLEIAEHEQAVDISIDMHRAVMAMAAPGRTESELMAEAVRVALAGGGMPSFQPIATVRGAVLHNHGYTGVLRDGDLFLLDAGAETLSGYAGDLTSTMPVSGRFSERQKAVYQLVLEAGHTATALLRPGLPFLEAHLAAARTITVGLQALGLMHGDVDESVAAGAHALFFPHGLGHQMGLDVHDMEALGENHVGYGDSVRSGQFGLRSLRLAKPLRTGMVLTVEPGIYFIEGLIADWSARGHLAEFINYQSLAGWVGLGGFRNEEDWLLTDAGARRLGKPFDKSVAAMERG
jgi:Xaa-Pro aminopeptidase